MSNLVFGVCESLVRAPFYMLSLHPAQPFVLGGWTPWKNWSCDRFAAFFDLNSFDEYTRETEWDEDEPLEAFAHDKNEANAKRLAEYYQGFYSFDGALAFIPASHAEDFYAYFKNLVDAGLSGLKDTPTDKLSEDFNVGDDASDVVAYWGSSTPDGLLLLFAMSADCLGENWLETALQRYPRRSEIMPPPNQAFDPKYAYCHEDCHLADHLSADRHEDLAYTSFLAWAHDKGYLSPAGEE